MTRLLTRFLAIGLIVASVSPLAAFHLALVRSTPTAGQTLDKAPPRLQLWFSEAPAAGVSQLRLTRDGAAVGLGKAVVVSKDKSVYADPSMPLVPGSYVLTWKTAGDDGHALSGKILFTIGSK